MEKKKIIILFSILGLFFLCRPVYAVVSTHDSNNTRICFNRSNGVYGGSHPYGTTSCPAGYGTDSVKLIDGKYAYCVEWRLRICSQNYNLDSSWDKNSKNAITAGIMMDLVEKEYSNTYQRYAMVGAVLNSFFYSRVNSSTSYNFYYTNSEVKKIYDQATNYEKELKLGSSLPALSFKINNNNSVLKLLDASTNTYISDKVEVSGLQEAYGGPLAEYGKANIKYSLTVSSSSGSVQFCSTSRGTGCYSSKELTNRSGSYSFYVKATGATADTTIRVNIKGSNQSTYPTVVRYVNANCGNSSQHLAVKDSVTINRSVSQSLQLVTPDLINHRIIGYKYDEYGESLKGASLEIFQDDVTKSSNSLAKNNGGSASVSYVSPKVEVSEDDFFNHDYFLVEDYAPDGYVLGSRVNQFYLKGSGGSNTSVCYYNGGNESDESEQVDSSRCNFDNYVYKCKPSDDSELKDLSEQQNCEFDTEIPEIGEDGEIVPGEGENGSENSGTGTDDTDDSVTEGTDNDGEGATDGSTEGSEDGGTEGSGDDSGETEEEPEKPTVTYQKICYSIKDKAVVEDETYCSDKDKYIKVTQTSGNIVVTQVNKKNVVKISKKDITGDNEISGAVLKICTATDYEDKKDECDPAKTIDDVEMNWVSTSQLYEFVGVPKGEYYIIEQVPPKGYIKATTATPFSIDESGDVKSGDTVITNEDFIKRNASIVIKNELNSITISKQDMATSKELPGATISICRTYKDENDEYQLIMDQYDNECISAVLTDGSLATWVSTDKPKVISGLAAGTYYLVEKIAPTDYETAESILFTLKSDGTLVDKDGNSLADNKLVMKDKSMNDVKTGSFSLYVVVGVLIAVIGLGAGSYYYLKKTHVAPVSDNSFNNTKIRKRKIHKK